MRVLFIILILLGLISSLKAQIAPTREFYTVNSHDIYFGYTVLGGDEADFEGPDIHMIEIGYARSHIDYGSHHGPASLAYYFTQAFRLNNSFITSSRVGVSLQALFASIGLSGIVYTDFSHFNFKIRPEFGVGGGRFRAVIGFNIPTFGNDRFLLVENAKYNITIGYCFPIQKTRTDHQ